MLQRVWYVHEPVSLTLQASPEACLHALALAAKPSVQRLQLREVFADGRRYFIEPLEDGFKLRVNSGSRWRYRRRMSGTIAVLFGKFERVDEQTTRIQLRARISVPYLIDTFFLPLFMSTLVLPYEPLLPVFRVAVAALLFGLSWGSHRAHAQLQAVDMVYFIGRALEDFAPAIVGALGPPSNDIRGDFRREWQKFYEEHQHSG